MNQTISDDNFWEYSARANFYLLPPSDNYVKELKDVSPIVVKAIPFMLVLTVVEWAILTLTGKARNWSLHDVIVNFSSGSLSQAVNSFFLRGIEFSGYLWVYSNLRITTLPWDSIYTYLIAVVGVDFCSYFWHRSCHEVALGWSFHYLHHSSEYLNMSVGARVSWIMRIIKWVFYLPMAALGLPPPAFLIHSQLGYAWGFWSHNDACPKLHKIIPGIGHLIEYILVTPSHHRVHHGVNPYCIDKNFGQLFIVWDRMFGTFAEEREDEDITFGTMSQVNSNHIFDIQVMNEPHATTYTQVRPTIEVLQRAASMPTFGDKLKALFYGPGWAPGTPRLGNPEDIPDMRGRKRFEIHLPHWFTAYIFVNCSVLFYTYLQMGLRMKDVTLLEQRVNLAIHLLTCTSVGGLYDGREYSVWLEPLRLLFYLVSVLALPIFSTLQETAVVAGVCLVSLLTWPRVSAITLSRAAEASATAPKKVN
ncbi:hypothetical protein Pcinc_014895 [Petrolisthes cinctipes]|uniref:Fatty acid hydroxylase domain-containing protein n=1 Tax=Petrolisthes cinctipes TaxID=88211 RepID=A0AAE1FW33_PETCI|nr:hypothetical protein Pcinc_014895 [Petrolisthes cinctipes]